MTNPKKPITKLPTTLKVSNSADAETITLLADRLSRLIDAHNESMPKQVSGIMTNSKTEESYRVPFESSPAPSSPSLNQDTIDALNEDVNSLPSFKSVSELKQYLMSHPNGCACISCVAQQMRNANSQLIKQNYCLKAELSDANEKLQAALARMNKAYEWILKHYDKCSDSHCLSYEQAIELLASDNDEDNKGEK